MGVVEIVSIALTVLLLVTIVYGFLGGLIKGLKKSTLRFFVLLVFIALAVLLTSTVSKSLLNAQVTINGATMSISKFITDFVTENEVIADLYNSSPNLAQFVNSLPLIVLNLVVFSVLVLIGNLLSYIVYLILAKILFKKKKETNSKLNYKKELVLPGEKEKKHRLLGGVVGCIQALTLMFVTLIPISGIMSTISDLSNSTSANVAYAQTEMTPTSKLINENLPKEVLDVVNVYESSFIGKVASVGNLDNLCFDTITTIKVGENKIAIRRELNYVATIYDNVAFLVEFDFKNGNLEDLDFDKIEKAIDALFNSGILQSLLPEVAEWAVNDITSENPTIKMEVSDYVLEIYRLFADELNSSNDKFLTLKTNIYSIFNVAKSTCESGIADILLAEKIDYNKLYDVLTHEDREVLETILDNLLNVNLLKRVVVNEFNKGIDQLEVEYQTTIGDISYDNVDWNQSRLKEIVFSALDIYDNLKETLSQDVVDKIEKEPYLVLNADVELICKKLNYIFTKLSETSLLTDENNNSLYPNLLDALDKSEINEYVDITVFKDKANIDSEFNNLSKALVAIKDSQLVNNISLNMTNDDYTQILKKLAKKDVEGNTYLNKTLKPVLNTKAFKKSLILGLEELNKLIDDSEKDLGENVDLGKIQVSALDSEVEKENILAFFENLVIYASELNLDNLEQDWFDEIITSNLSMLGLALDSLGSSQLFAGYIENGIAHDGIYVSLIKALANNEDINQFADFSKALEDDFSWNYELDKIQIAITTMNNIKVNIDGQEKTLIEAINDGDDLTTAFESISTDNDDIDNMIYPLTQSKLMSKNIILFVNTLNESMNDILDANIEKLPSDTSFEGQEEDIVNIVKSFIDLYKLAKDGLTTEKIESSYQELGTTLNLLQKNALCEEYEGVFEQTYDAVIEYLKQSEYGDKIEILLDNYTDRKNVDWVELLSLAVEAKDINEDSTLSQEFIDKFVVVIDSMYQDEDYGMIAKDLLQMINSFLEVDENSDKIETLNVLSSSIANLEKYNDKSEKVNELIDFVSSLIPTNKLDFLKNTTSYTQEKSQVDALIETYELFDGKEDPEYTDYTSLVDSLAQSDITLKLFNQFDIKVEVDSIFEEAVETYINENFNGETKDKLIGIFA